MRTPLARDHRGRINLISGRSHRLRDDECVVLNLQARDDDLDLHSSGEHYPVLHRKPLAASGILLTAHTHIERG